MKSPYSVCSSLFLLIELYKAKEMAGITRRDENHIEEIYRFCYAHLFKGGELNSDVKIDLAASNSQNLVFNVNLDAGPWKWSEHVVNVTRDNSEQGFLVLAYSVKGKTPGGKDKYHATLVEAFTAQLSKIIPNAEIADVW